MCGTVFKHVSAHDVAGEDAANLLLRLGREGLEVAVTTSVEELPRLLPRVLDSIRMISSTPMANAR